MTRRAAPFLEGILGTTRFAWIFYRLGAVFACSLFNWGRLLPLSLEKSVVGRARFWVRDCFILSIEEVGQRF